MPTPIVNPADIGRGVRQGVTIYEGVFTPITGLVGPLGEPMGPLGTYSSKVSVGDYVQPWTASDAGHTIVAKAYDDTKPVGRIMEQPLGFPVGIDATSSTAVTVSNRADQRRATVEWLHGNQIIRGKVVEACLAGTMLGLRAATSDWSTTSVPTTASLRPGAPTAMALESASAGGLHQLLVLGG